MVTTTKAKLYGTAKGFRTLKVLIAAKIGNVNLEIIDSAPPRQKFPFGITPAFEDGSTMLFGADSIALHLIGKNLGLPNCSEVMQWLQWAEANLLPNVLGYVLPCISVARLAEEASGDIKKELFSQLEILDQCLLKRTFLVGERLSLADISIAVDLLLAFQHIMDKQMRAKYINLTRWFKTIMNQKIMKEVVGEIHFAEQCATFNEEKFNEFATKHTKKPLKEVEQAIQQKRQKEVSSNTGVPNPVPASTMAPEDRFVCALHYSTETEKKEKHSEKKGKYAKKEDNEEMGDATEEVLANEPKSVDPFQSMPKGGFVMDQFKKVYSNEDTAVSIPYFWNNFDKENYSIWFAEYKFPEDLTLSFMSCNLIGGMFQRLEKLKKNAFASVCLFGTDNNSTISGVWIWRGHELVFELCPDWQVDYESYEWKKLDASDPKTKEIVNEYLKWEGDFDGKKFNQGKIFK